jgi:hypothetical protein
VTDEGKNEVAASAEGVAISSHSSRADLAHPEDADMPEAMDLSQQHTKSETIELGRFDLVDEFNAASVAARPKSRGLLPVPPEVEAAVADDDSSLVSREPCRVFWCRC